MKTTFGVNDATSRTMWRYSPRRYAERWRALMRHPLTAFIPVARMPVRAMMQRARLLRLPWSLGLVS